MKSSDFVVVLVNSNVVKSLTFADAYNLAILSPAPKPVPVKFSIKDLIGDGLLWAVPKSRRTIEKRLKRKFGDPKYVWKPYVPKTHLLVCNTCGHHYEAGILCRKFYVIIIIFVLQQKCIIIVIGHCYNKVKAETQEMQDKIINDLGLKPDDKDVVVLYDGENVDKVFYTFFLLFVINIYNN